MIMTVEELIKELEKFPKDLKIEVDDGNYDFVIRYVCETISSFDLETKVCNITIEPV